ncbi:hypothetical protein BB560_000549 [Smittium megazygosporum]|uniref:Uncharacterized protein n=1 Tax=Smittium megazygosporum TaxID=133381 RepID=A0A2T9ZK50_9FUNG|nr:hypothetical protein BB560_000549 [Smittium megazygosporum]
MLNNIDSRSRIQTKTRAVSDKITSNELNELQIAKLYKEYPYEKPTSTKLSSSN